MKKRFILSEDFDSDFDSSNAITLVVDPTNLDNIQMVDLPSEKTQEVQQEEIGVTQMLSDLIKDEWKAIDGYKSVIATLKSFGDKYSDIIKVLEDIFPEELVHVGQLEKVMELVTPQASEITTGQAEAEEQITTPSLEPVVMESCKKHKHKPLKETFTYSGKGYEDYIAYWMDEAQSEIDYLIDDGDDEDETVQLLRGLNGEGLEELCNRVANEITNSDYLWEQINERIIDVINDNIQEIADDDEYRIEKPTEIELPKKDKEEEKTNED